MKKGEKRGVVRRNVGEYREGKTILTGKEN